MRKKWPKLTILYLDKFSTPKVVRPESSKAIEVDWDSLSPNNIPVTNAERALLDYRIADMELSPDDQSPWPDVKNRLERLLR
jgi:hypothetical protein